MASQSHIQFIAFNVKLRLDVLQCDCPATAFIVILQTVIQELRNLNLAAYRRVLSLLRDEGRSFIFYPNELSSDTTVARYFRAYCSNVRMLLCIVEKVFKNLLYI